MMLKITRGGVAQVLSALKDHKLLLDQAIEALEKYRKLLEKKVAH